MPRPGRAGATMAIGQLYEVFARSTRNDALAHIGTVNATSTDFARVYARTTYDEENWVEMVVVERAAFIPVIELELLVKPEGSE
jgi:1,2-phenylacetyl-CoA epoxidase PaaB subunit